MKYLFVIVSLLFLTLGCLKEKYRGEHCLRKVAFEMKEVPYVVVGEDVVGYRPYYTFIERLDLFVFSEQLQEYHFKYDFAYCREHAVIAETVGYDAGEALFVANLYDPKELNWGYENGELKAVFRIVDYEEPPVLLAAVADIGNRQDSVPVELRLLISRLEIKLENPPAWMVGLKVNVRNIAASVSLDYRLGDTTHIDKQLFFDNQGPGTYWLGVNTFPTYSDKPALLILDPIGTEPTAPIVVDDTRLHLLPGVITRLNLAFDSMENITISVKIDGKWEIVDGGSIII